MVCLTLYSGTKGYTQSRSNLLFVLPLYFLLLLPVPVLSPACTLNSYFPLSTHHLSNISVFLCQYVTRLRSFLWTFYAPRWRWISYLLTFISILHFITITHLHVCLTISPPSPSMQLLQGDAQWPQSECAWLGLASRKPF